MESQVKLLGMVLFYRANYQDKTLTETNRTRILPHSEALFIYAETPNPASQLVSGVDEEDLKANLKTLEENVKDPKWLEELFNCI